MGTELAQVTVSDLDRMAQAIAKSGLFSIKTADQALVLLLISQAEGRSPALAARDYDIIQGRPSKKAEAMLRDFLSSGGKVEWHELTDTAAAATFSHPQGGSARIDWDMRRAKAAGLGGKDMWSKYPRQMLRSRVVSEGVRTVWPAATSGMYVPEEVADFGGREPKETRERDIGGGTTSPGVITPTDGAMDRVDQQTADRVHEIATAIRTALVEDRDFDAYATYEGSGLDADQKVALWTLLDSKERRRLKAQKQAELAKQVELDTARVNAAADAPAPTVAQMAEDAPY